MIHEYSKFLTGEAYKESYDTSQNISTRNFYYHHHLKFDSEVDLTILKQDYWFHWIKRCFFN